MPGGRPTKRTLSAKDTIVQAIGLGATYARAAAAAGITYETLRVWREEDSAFSVALEKASGERVTNALRRLEAAAKKGNWQADAWLLERLYPHEYGRTVQEHTGEQKLTISIARRHKDDSTSATATSQASRESEAAS